MFAPAIEPAAPVLRRSPFHDALELFERSSAVILLAASTPVLLPALLTVRLLSGRPPLIAHRRAGLHGQPFGMLKLRTMWKDRSEGAVRSWIEAVEDAAVPVRKSTADPRVTSRFARFCRRFSIDELPQLWHVVRGEMRFIGPRPLTPKELCEHYGHAAAREVLSVRPGLTGLWQIRGRNRLTYAQRRRLDLFLVRHSCPRLYWRILIRTPALVLSGRDAR